MIHAALNVKKFRTADILGCPDAVYFILISIGWQGQIRFWRAEMRPYFFKALDNTASILGGLFIVWPHFCSVKTAAHLTGMDFRVIFVFWDAGGLSPFYNSNQSPTKWVWFEKEEGDCRVQLLPRGGSGTVQASSDETERRAVRRVCPC